MKPAILSLLMCSSAFAASPAIDHIETASGFGGFVGAASPASWIEIYGSNLAGTTRAWNTSDFSGTTAPTTLDGVSVSINGSAAYISYVSPGQINAELPNGIPAGSLPVVVTYEGVSSAPFSLTINTVEPGLLAPSSFAVGGKQYVVATHASGGAYVTSGNIAGVSGTSATGGETLVFYGTGFGTVNPATSAGQIVSGQSALTNTFSMTLGGTSATVTYAGLSPGLVGLYQFNVVVPSNLSSGDVLVQTALNGAVNTLQTLYLPVAGSLGLPGAPTGVSAAAGNTTAALSFTAPSSATTITGYTATCTAGSFAKTATATGSPLFIAGLTNGTTYSCTVAATTAAGTGSASTPVSVTPALAASASYNNLWIPDTLTGTTFNLTLAPGTKQLRSGELTNTYSYNGSGFWGPTLIMNQGDTVQLNVTNQLSETTTTHWHGFHIPAIWDGGPHQPIEPQETWSPSFVVKNNASLYWYHPHLHMKTVEQILYGAGGFIIVKDPTEASLALPRTYGVDDIPLVFTSRSFLAGGNQINTNVSITPYGDYQFTNGTMNSQVTMPKQFVRFRMLNAEIERANNIGFKDGRTFYIIGNDGGLLNAPVPVTTVKLFAGERVEILVDLTKDAVGAALDMQSFNGGQTFGFPGGEPATSGTFGSLLNNTTFNVLHIVVGASTPGAITALPSALVNNTYLTSADVTNSRTVHITDNGPGTPFVFDSVAFNADTINQTVSNNAVEAWTIVNDQVFSHSFHIHDVQFKIISRSTGSVGAYEQGWKDTVEVPLGTSVTFVARFSDFTDVVNPYMYHCHFSNHEDDGMMGQFIVIP